jgi:hypothetical protein
MYSTLFKSAIAATLFASANAHFLISSPAPIPASAIKDPLDASGSNFPCHGADLSAASTVTPLTAGSTFNLQYALASGANTAVHGGGSCQISMTYETDATKVKDPASWKVIASFVGGCPTNALANLDTDPKGATMCGATNAVAAPNCVNALNFKVPAEVTNGNAVLAWTWFNNVGNREMYMNCAKVSVTGGSGSMGSLPALFVANLASVNQCKTTESHNTDFPNPGAYVTKENPPNFPLLAPVGDCGSGSGSANAAPAASGGSGTTAAASPAASAASTLAVAASSAAPNNGQYTGVGASSAAVKATSVASNPGGIFAPGASSVAATNAAPTATSVIATTFVTAASPAAATQAASTPAAASASAPAPAAASPAASAPATSGSCLSGQVACTASGFYCISQTTFGMCAFGCATPMQMADGTDCSNGAVVHAINHPKRKQIRNVHRRHAVGSF